MLMRFFQLQSFAAKWAQAILKSTGECAVMWEQTAYNVDNYQRLLTERHR